MSQKPIVSQLMRNPHVLNQGWTDDEPIPESSISASNDGCGLIILDQEGRHIIINKSSVNELCKLLKKLEKTA